MDGKGDATLKYPGDETLKNLISKEIQRRSIEGFERHNLLTRKFRPESSKISDLALVGKEFPGIKVDNFFKRLLQDCIISDPETQIKQPKKPHNYLKTELDFEKPGKRVFELLTSLPEKESSDSGLVAGSREYDYEEIAKQRYVGMDKVINIAFDTNKASCFSTFFSSSKKQIKSSLNPLGVIVFFENFLNEAKKIRAAEVKVAVSADVVNNHPRTDFGEGNTLAAFLAPKPSEPPNEPSRSPKSPRGGVAGGDPRRESGAGVFKSG